MRPTLDPARDVVIVPEPASWLLAALGSAIVLLVSRPVRRRLSSF